MLPNDIRDRLLTELRVQHQIAVEPELKVAIANTILRGFMSKLI